METYFNIGEKKYKTLLNEPLPIGIRMENGPDNNPNCFYALPPEIKPYVSGEFIGSIAQGSPVNFKNVFFNPHGNGTHTECSGHIFDNGLFIGGLLKKFHFSALLISMEPIDNEGDAVIQKPDFLDSNTLSGVEALLLRTLPNSNSKKYKKYSGSNPPYFHPDFMALLNENNIQHFLTDLPSVDKEKDDGALNAHKAFWNSDKNDRTRCTITELVFIPDDILDGMYLLELQVMNLALDAAPSNPILYRLEPI
nr:cyclase family protein [Saprospiraceae bacterium]